MQVCFTVTDCVSARLPVCFFQFAPSANGGHLFFEVYKDTKMSDLIESYAAFVGQQVGHF